MNTSTNYSRLRLMTALLIIASGAGQVALLWLRDLEPNLLINAFLGVVYLIIGIGLLGQSRFTLFIAIAVPLAAAAMLINTIPSGALSTLQLARLGTDVLVAVCAALILANTRE